METDQEYKIIISKRSASLLISLARFLAEVSPSSAENLITSLFLKSDI